MLRILLLAAFVLFSSVLYGQEIKMDVTPAQKTLKSVIEKIEKETNFTFVFSSSVDLDQSVSLDIRQQSIEAILVKAFEGKGIDFEIVGTQVILNKKTGLKASVSGVVLGADGETLAGASIVDKGRSFGVTTDINGKFTLNNIELPATLLISYLGYESREVPVNKATELQIVLSESERSLNEVVVVGFGTQKRINLTGAVSTISSKELNSRPVISTANALQGLDPAVNLTMGTGSPNSDYQIDIRGSVSLNAGSPLILADGIEVDLRQINPNDIESISILKDASASAVYGAKASAGVILITTKSGGKEGKTDITYSGRFGVAQNTTSTDFMTVGYDYVTFTNPFYNSYQGVDMLVYPESNGELQKLLDRRNDKTENPARPWVEVGGDGKYYYYANFDWFGYLYNRTRTQNEHNISIRGGNSDLNYYISGRYLHQNGIFRIYGDTFSDVSFRAKFNAKLNKKLRYSLGVNFDNSEMSYPGRPEYEQTISSLQANTPPTFVPLNPDGSIVQYSNQHYAGSPMGTGYTGAMTANNSWNSRRNRYFIIQNQLDYDITRNLVLTASYGYKMRDPLNRYRNNTFEYSRQLDVIQTFSSGAVANNYTENRYTETTGSADAYLTYKNTWNENHNFTAVGGAQFYNYRYHTMQGTRTNLSNDDLASFSVATGDITLMQTINTLRTLGFFGRLNYDYAGKYLLEVSARADGSSRFEPSSRWGFFPSASVGWRVSGEDFFEPVRSVVSDFKIRLSAGSLGNHQMDSYYAYLDRINSNDVKDYNYTFDDTQKAVYASVSDPISSSLTWETVTTYNLGSDISFLNNRLWLNTDFYIRDTKNMLAPSLTLPDVFGAETPEANSVDMRTKGYEISLSWNDRFTLASKPFRYGVTLTLGDYMTKITRFYNPKKSLSDHYVGKTLGEIWGYRVEGLFKTDEEAAEYQARIDDRAVNQRVYGSKGIGENILRAGDVKFIDLNGDNIISQGAGTVGNPGDREIIGNSLPRYSYSMRFNFAWNNIDLSVFFQGVGKRDWYPTAGQSSFDFWGPYAFPTTSFIHKDFPSLCWSEDNADAYFPRQRGYQAYADGALAETNDRYLQNAAYLRLKNLSIGYTLPVLKSYVKQMRVSLTGENLFYWSPLKKYTKTMDPELTFTKEAYNDNSGVGYFYSKIYSVNIDITF